MRLTIILEKGDDELWGRLEIPNHLHVTVGKNLKEVENNLRDLMNDYIQNDGQEFEEWRDLKANDIKFSYVYDPMGSFEAIEKAKIMAISKKSGIKLWLVKEYLSGNKYPSYRQAKRLESAIKNIEDKLVEFALS